MIQVEIYKNGDLYEYAVEEEEWNESESVVFGDVEVFIFDGDSITVTNNSAISQEFILQGDNFEPVSIDLEPDESTDLVLSRSVPA